MTATVMTRLDHVRRTADGEVVNATDPDVLSEAEMAGRRQALEYARFLIDKVPGYEQASLIALSTQIGMRETRRVYGDYRVTREDVLMAMGQAAGTAAALAAGESGSVRDVAFEAIGERLAKDGAIVDVAP